MKDGHGRTIDYLRISLTDRCNYRCIYCMPEEGVQSMCHTDILRIEEIAHVVRVFSNLGIKSVRLTGGEPLVRKGVVDLVRDINDMPGIKNISLTTNGVLLPRMADQLRQAGLSRVNISLDTLDAEQFHAITRRGYLQEALDGIDAALAAGFNPVKINAVAVRQLHQDYLAFAKLSIDRPLHVRFIEYMPVGESSGANGCGWGPARYFEFPGAKGTVGFISPMSRHFCGECNRMRLTADGKLRPCLFSDREYDIRGILRSGKPEDQVDRDLADVFRTAIGAKPDDHDDITGTERRMSQIGG